MADGSVWFSAAIGRKKNAEARWLLPMICRRGGIEKHDIGAIRILDTTTEFEISERVAPAFAVKIRRPDKEDNIRIAPLADVPQGQAPSENRFHAPRREGNEPNRGARQNHKSRDEREPKQHGKSHRESGSRFDEASSKKKRHQGKPAYAGQPRPASASPAKPAFGKKTKKNRRG
ncbi:DbpA RNA binding domain protein [mine drainage metagenome]|uniref:DbpA RNA binding domain protein n=1 Tax=mine drainage metagenome TaxID=410659 RepID=A0A1J5PFH6_9ZZZZ